jgi:hypothetical protein
MPIAYSMLCTKGLIALILDMDDTSFYFHRWWIILETLHWRIPKNSTLIKAYKEIFKTFTHTKKKKATASSSSFLQVRFEVLIVIIIKDIRRVVRMWTDDSERHDLHPQARKSAKWSVRQVARRNSSFWHRVTNSSCFSFAPIPFPDSRPHFPRANWSSYFPNEYDIVFDGAPGILRASTWLQYSLMTVENPTDSSSRYNPSF